MTVPFPRRVGDEPAPVSAPAPSPAVTSISPGAASPAPNGTLLVLSMGAVARRTVVIVGTAATVLALLAFTWYARQVLLVVFGGVLLGVFLRRLALLVARVTRLPVMVSLGVTVVGLLAILVGAFWAQGETVTAEATRLTEEFPAAVDKVRLQVEAQPWGARALQQIPPTDSLLPSASGAISTATGFVSRTVGVLGSAGIIIFLGLVLAATPRVYTGGLLALLPARMEPRAREVLDRLGDTLWWWLLGRLISMTTIGVLTGIGLSWLGIPLAFILGVLAGLLSFIPNVGPILSALPAIVLGFVQGPQAALSVTALYIGVQIIESWVLGPWIDRKTIYMPPAFTVGAQLVLALVAGLAGLTLATPLAAVLMVLVTMLYVQDVLKRDIDVPAR